MAVLPGVAEIVDIPVTVSWDVKLCTYGIATACGFAVAWPGAARIVAGVAVIIAPVTVGVAATPRLSSCVARRCQDCSWSCCHCSSCCRNCGCCVSMWLGLPMGKSHFYVNKPGCGTGVDKRSRDYDWRKCACGRGICHCSWLAVGITMYSCHCGWCSCHCSCVAGLGSW